MITLNLLHPNKDGATFDMNYYLTSHIPMLKRVLGSALKACIVEQGLGPVAEQIRDDVANYASETPITQLSDVIVAS